MRNYQRLMALTLITSIAATSVASSRAWADENGFRYVDRSATVQQPVRRVVTEVQSRQFSTTDIYRDDSADLTCKKYSGMDRERLQGMYDDLRLKHAENFAEKPVGSAAVGAVAGAALTVVTGGLALVGAVIGGLFGGLFSWFKGGKSEPERDLANRKKDAQFDEETLKLNCMENELKKSQIYAGRLPNEAPVGIYTDARTKQTVASSGSGSSSRSYDSYGEPAGAGSADGYSTGCPYANGSSGSSGSCSSSRSSSSDDYYVRDGGSGSEVPSNSEFDSSYGNRAPAVDRSQATVIDHSSRAVSDCFK